MGAKLYMLLINICTSLIARLPVPKLKKINWGGDEDHCFPQISESRDTNTLWLTKSIKYLSVKNIKCSYKHFKTR